MTQATTRTEKKGERCEASVPDASYSVGALYSVKGSSERAILYGEPVSWLLSLNILGLRLVDDRKSQ